MFESEESFESDRIMKCKRTESQEMAEAAVQLKNIC
jgi:hypothetical protein